MLALRIRLRLCHIPQPPKADTTDERGMDRIEAAIADGELDATGGGIARAEPSKTSTSAQTFYPPAQILEESRIAPTSRDLSNGQEERPRGWV